MAPRAHPRVNRRPVARQLRLSPETLWQLGLYQSAAHAARQTPLPGRPAPADVSTSGISTGGFGDLLGNFAHDILGIAVGAPSFLQLAAREAAVPVAYPLERLGGLHQGTTQGLINDIGATGQAIVQDYKTRWGPLFRGDISEFRHQAAMHPGLLALDVGAAWSGAGSAVRSGAAAGAGAGLFDATGAAARIAERSVLREGTHTIGGHDVYSTGARYGGERVFRSPLGENTALSEGGPIYQDIVEARRARSANPLTRAVQDRITRPITQNFSAFLEHQGNLAREGASGRGWARMFSSQSRYNRAAGRAGRNFREDAELQRAGNVRAMAGDFLDAVHEAKKQYGKDAAAAIYLHVRDLLDVPGETASAARKAVADFMERGLQEAIVGRRAASKSRGAGRTIRAIEHVPENLLTLEGNPVLERAVTAARSLADEATRMRVEAGTLSPETAATIGARAAEQVHGGSVYDPNFIRPTERVLAARQAYGQALAARQAGPRLTPFAALRRAFAGGRAAGRGDRNLELAPAGEGMRPPMEGLPRAADTVLQPEEAVAGRGVMRGQRVLPDGGGPAPHTADLTAEEAAAARDAAGGDLVPPAEALTTRVNQLHAEADAIERGYRKRLAQKAKDLRDYREAVKAKPRYVGKNKLRGTAAGNEAYRGAVGDAQEAAQRAAYSRNIRDPERYRAGGGKKSLTEHGQDYLQMIEKAHKAGMDVPAEDLAMLDAVERVAELRSEADSLQRHAATLSGENSWLYDTADRVRAEAAGRAVAEAHGMRVQPSVVGPGPAPARVSLGNPVQMALYGRRSRGPITPSERVVVNAPVGPGKGARPVVTAARARAYGQVLRGEGRGYTARVHLRQSMKLNQAVKDARAEVKAAEREARGGWTPPNRSDLGTRGVYHRDIPVDRLATARSDAKSKNALARFTQDKVHENHGTLFGQGNVSIDPRNVVAALDRALVDQQHPGFIRSMVDRFAYRQGGEVATGDRAILAMAADPENVVLINRKVAEDAMRLGREVPEGAPPTDPFHGADILEGDAGLAAAKLIPEDQLGDTIAFPKAALDAVRQGFGPGKQWAIYDTPLQLWRRGILAFAPRWYLNNLFGNTLQYGLLSGFDVKALFDARMSRQGGAVPERIGGSSLVNETRLGDTVNMSRGRAGFERASNVGMDFNQRVEGLIRRAAFLNRAKKGLGTVGIDIRKMSGEELGRLLEDVPTELMDNFISDTELFMGNYVRMHPMERAILKRIFPFYSWMRVIGRFMGGVPIMHPKRVALAAAVSRAAAEVENPENKYLPLYDRSRFKLPGGLAWRTFSANPLTTHAELIANVASGNPVNVAGGLARDITPVGGQQLLQYVTGENAFGRPFSAPPGYGGSVSAFGYDPSKINPATGLVEGSPASPPWWQMALDTVPVLPALVRGIAAGGRTPYDTTTTPDLIFRSKPDWQLFRPSTGDPASEQLSAGPVPINPFLSLLGLNTVRVNEDAVRARYAANVARFREAQRQTAKRIEKASRP